MKLAIVVPTICTDLDRIKNTIDSIYYSLKCSHHQIDDIKLIISVDSTYTDFSNNFVEILENYLTIIGINHEISYKGYNSGLYLTRILEAKRLKNQFDYIMFVDDDDTISPDFINLLLASSNAVTADIYSPRVVENRKFDNISYSKCYPIFDSFPNLIKFNHRASSLVYSINLIANISYIYNSFANEDEILNNLVLANHPVMATFDGIYYYNNFSIDKYWKLKLPKESLDEYNKAINYINYLLGKEVEQPIIEKRVIHVYDSIIKVNRDLVNTDKERHSIVILSSTIGLPKIVNPKISINYYSAPLMHKNDILERELKILYNYFIQYSKSVVIEKGE